MFKRILSLVLLGALLTVGWAIAQDDAPPATRPIYTVLAYGDDVFEPEIWLASAVERDDRATATWSASLLSAVAYIEYLYFDADPIDRESMDTYFDNAWFDTVLSSYDSYQKTGVCYGDDVTLHTFDLTLVSMDQSFDYSMRYWTEWLDETRLTTFFLLFPVFDTEGLDIYAERLYPDLPACNS